MVTNSDVGDRIIGETILCNARKIIENVPFIKVEDTKYNALSLKIMPMQLLLKNLDF